MRVFDNIWVVVIGQTKFQIKIVCFCCVVGQTMSVKIENCVEDNFEKSVTEFVTAFTKLTNIKFDWGDENYVE